MPLLWRCSWTRTARCRSAGEGFRAPLQVSGRSLRPEDVAGLQRLAEGFEEVAAQCAAFVALFLHPEGAL